MNEELLLQARELLDEVHQVVKNKWLSYGGQKKCGDIEHPNFTLLFEGYKDTYNPLYGGVSLGSRMNKVVFQCVNQPEYYVVILESGSYLVKSRRFVVTKPFSRNLVTDLNKNVLRW